MARLRVEYVIETHMHADFLSGHPEPAAATGATVTGIGVENADFLEFRGFDLNDPIEGTLLCYGRHLLAADRWTDLAEYFDDKHDRGNYHSRRLPSYRRMLEVYEPMSEAKTSGGRGLNLDHFLFSADELTAVARAALLR
ncbi:MAG TPA: YfbU family protein [Streptosporangiaceae bacterium]